MGTCDSPVEANLTLLFYEYQFIDVLGSFIIYKRYIDDIFIVSKRTDIQHNTQQLNAIFPNNYKLKPTKQAT